VKTEGGATSEGIAEAVFGTELLRGSWLPARLQRAWSLTERYRVPLIAIALGGLIFLPYLGAVGLWDPWETNYGEVARSMIVRSDYVHPFWQDAWFFSKPVLTMWLSIPGMLLVGVAQGDGRLPLYTEWAMRLPFALLAVLGLGLLAFSVSRVVSRRVALAAAFALSTMPLYLLLARQAIPDMPFAATFTCAMACAIIGQLDASTRHRTAWWYGFYAFCGLSTLAKGLMGGGLPAVILMLYGGLCVLPWDRASLANHAQWLLSRKFRERVRQGNEPLPALWAQMRSMRLGSGLILFSAIAAPWYAAMIRFPGVDNEGKTFFQRFFIHDHFQRLAVGVHTTTPGGTFTYFIEQGGFGLFPWVALLPGALMLAGRFRFRSEEPRDRLGALALLWAASAFALFASSATKFHHYILPVLPALAILIALFVDRLWEEGIAEHTGALALGLVLFGLVGKDLADNPRRFLDLFTYNYERPYPIELITRPMGFVGGYLIGTVKGLLGLAFLAAGAFCTAAALVGSRRTMVAGFVGLSLGLALWLSWSHWVDMSHHWTQRDLFWRYYALRRPGEPIAAFLMDWKGETFYSQNTVKQIGLTDTANRARQFASLPGRKWMLVEHNRFNLLQNSIGPGHVVTPVDREVNNKFILLQID
jgi:4-amino-4-deoxy-L-arabinose transferase-like glycosyltransferase